MFEQLKQMPKLGFGVAGPFEGANTGFTPFCEENRKNLFDTCDFFEYYNSSVFTTNDKLDLPWMQEKKLLAHSGFLNVGASEDLNSDLVKLTKEICELRPPLWIGEDVGTNYLHGQIFPDIIPPITSEDGANVIAQRIKFIQRELNLPFLVENTYCYNPIGNMEEWKFFELIAEIADCGLLLDIGHLWISLKVMGKDPLQYVQTMNLEKVIELHVASVRQDQRLPTMYYDDHSSKATIELMECAKTIQRRAPNLKATTVELPNAKLNLILDQLAELKK